MGPTRQIFSFFFLPLHHLPLLSPPWLSSPISSPHSLWPLLRLTPRLPPPPASCASASGGRGASRASPAWPACSLRALRRRRSRGPARARAPGLPASSRQRAGGGGRPAGRLGGREPLPSPILPVPHPPPCAGALACGGSLARRELQALPCGAAGLRQVQRGRPVAAEAASERLGGAASMPGPPVARERYMRWEWRVPSRALAFSMT